MFGFKMPRVFRKKEEKETEWQWVSLGGDRRSREGGSVDQEQQQQYLSREQVRDIYKWLSQNPHNVQYQQLQDGADRGGSSRGWKIFK